jgi:hypothetical protein
MARWSTDSSIAAGTWYARRVLVAHDRHQRQIALDWIAAGQPFRGYIAWKQKHHERMTVGEFLDAFEALAAEDDPFAYPIRYITPKH